MTDKPPLTLCRVVSLASASERRAVFSERAEGSGVKWSFFDACTQKHPDLAYDVSAVRASFGRSLGKGEIGCFSSHYALWQELIAEPDATQYLVVEDDVILDWTMAKTLCEIDFTSQGINYLRLMFKVMRPFISRKIGFGTRQRSIIELYGWAFGTQAYMITKAGAQAFSEALNTIEMPIDDQMDQSWHHGIPNLAIFPPIAMEEAVPSAIAADRLTDDKSRRINSAFRSAGRRKAKRAYWRAKAKDIVGQRLKR